MAVSTDLVSTNNPNNDDGLDVGVDQSTNVNTGVYFVKTTPGGRHFMSQWAGLRESMKHDNDQVGLYKYLRGTPVFRNMIERSLELGQPCSGTPEQVKECRAGHPKLGMLSVAKLLNGYSYFIPRCVWRSSSRHLLCLKRGRALPLMPAA